MRKYKFSNPPHQVSSQEIHSAGTKAPNPQYITRTISYDGAYNHPEATVITKPSKILTMSKSPIGQTRTIYDQPRTNYITKAPTRIVRTVTNDYAPTAPNYTSPTYTIPLVYGNDYQGPNFATSTLGLEPSGIQMGPRTPPPVIGMDESLDPDKIKFLTGFSDENKNFLVGSPKMQKNEILESNF
jgi:hypothetical protein